MAKRQPKKNIIIDKREGQLSAHGGEVNYFFRNVPLWNPPSWQTAEVWRQFVIKQPIAAICRDTIANYLNSLDWSIVARDSDQQDELRAKVKHYTKLFERGNAYYYDIDFASHIEWIVKDLYDLPFGAASEIGRIDDAPSGKVVWIRPLDGGTLAPTLNFDFPVVQVAPTTNLAPVYLPRDFVSRVYLSPRTELRREGWGYAPPERIWRAMEMLSSGDDYYARLMLNTPEAGILDLGDTEKDTALNWIKSLQDLLFGINPLKIPVLYEHTTQAKWIPFGKPPSEIMYDTTTAKYAAILTAGYGLTLSDIGYPTSSGGGGDTLAGTIRMQGVGKGSGKAIAKKKTESYLNHILPDSLKFTWIDYDDERNVSKGRARLASAQSADVWIRNRVFKPSEIRQQALADGLISISIPETIDPNDEEFIVIQQAAVANKIGGSRTKTLGNPVAPSAGGQGEVIPQQIIQRNMANAEVGISKAVFSAVEILSALLFNVNEKLSQTEMEVWNQYVDNYLTGKSDIEEVALKDVFEDVLGRIYASVGEQDWVADFSNAISRKALADAISYEKSHKAFLAEQDAEQKYIEGESDGIDVEENDIALDVNETELSLAVHKSFAENVARYSVLHLKSKLASTFGVDATEAMDNNIRVSRETSREVLQSLSEITKAAYESGIKFIQTTGDQDAVS